MGDRHQNDKSVTWTDCVNTPCYSAYTNGISIPIYWAETQLLVHSQVLQIPTVQPQTNLGQFPVYGRGKLKCCLFPTSFSCESNFWREVQGSINARTSSSKPIFRRQAIKSLVLESYLCPQHLILGLEALMFIWSIYIPVFKNTQETWPRTCLPQETHLR